MEEVIIADLANVDKWYEKNEIMMMRNASKHQAIVVGKSQVILQFYCENTAILITEDLEMLRVTVDDKMKFEIIIFTWQIPRCRKVSINTYIHTDRRSLYSSE